MQDIFKIGDTIKIVTRLFDDNGDAFNISAFTVRSVLKLNSTEIVGTIQKPDNFTVITIFDTSGAQSGKYKTDVRFSNLSESFSTPVNIIEITEKVS